MFSRSRLIRSNPLLFCFIFFVLLLLSTIFFFDQSKSFHCHLSSIETSTKSFFNENSINFLHDEDSETRLNDVSIWCFAFESRLDFEDYLPLTPRIRAPSMNRTSTIRLPYRYAFWKTTSLLPREKGFTRCEHYLVMNLLLIIDKICRRNRIEMILYAGTLLGSWRHHDIIPWDDDVDVMIPYEYRERFLQSLNEYNQTLIGYHTHTNSKGKTKYYKVFFAQMDSAGGYSWKFPFIDVFLYKTNTSHFWVVNEEETVNNLTDVFPLVLRPLGELWLPTPRHTEKFFSFDPFDDCIGHFWSHRNETSTSSVEIKCNELRSYYPFVHRSNDSNSTEILKLNSSIIHTIIYS